MAKSVSRDAVVPIADAVLPVSVSGCLFRTAYGPHKRVAITFSGSGRTKQSFKDECDINRLMARYLATGALSHVRQGVPSFQDVSSVDFQQAMDLVAGAQTAFFDLPSALRSRFDNEPAKLLAFLENPINRPEAVELGLVNPPALQATPVAPPPLASAPALANAPVGASSTPSVSSSS
ncbi:MAG: internal scaffolding protein [Microviridae sp.]|nr:MAG: internal scaffolding protein [Microviridae sp.]